MKELVLIICVIAAGNAIAYGLRFAAKDEVDRSQEATAKLIIQQRAIWDK